MFRRPWPFFLCAVFCASMLTPAYAGIFDRPAETQPEFVTLPARGVNTRTLEAQAAASMTVPFFSSTVKSPLDGNTYSYRLIGTNPSTAKVSTTVKYAPFLLRVHFADGTVIDPTKPACNDGVSVGQREYGSPLFNPTPLTSNGVSVGTTQITDAFQRANFWKYVAGTNYHVLLAAASSPRLIDVTAPAGSTTSPGVCAGAGHREGFIDINAFDSIATQIINKYAAPNQFAIIAMYNVFESFSGGGAAAGYHSAYGRSTGTQTYAISVYNDPGIGTRPHPDIAVMSHEIGEWMDDPFIDNATPAWGHLGQVRGCQSNLEDGDPLSGLIFSVKYNGFTYHPQELAFFSWFYRTPSTGTGGKFSFNGTFKSSQGPC